jgi:hypothetical protein
MNDLDRKCAEIITKSWAHNDDGSIWISLDGSTKDHFAPSTRWKDVGICIVWAEIEKRDPMEIRWVRGGEDRYLRFGPANPNWDFYPNEVLIPYETGLTPEVIAKAFVAAFGEEKKT